ncbi:MAG: hypothetical protein HGB35_01625 [Geobacteraceae bacterium]|nr:hypothetical protein [Geobacteraceae bacterium]
MNTSETNGISSRHNTTTGTMIWSGCRRVIRQSEAHQHCFYCSGSFECGQQECIWLQACA